MNIMLSEFCAITNVRKRKIVKFLLHDGDETQLVERITRVLYNLGDFALSVPEMKKIARVCAVPARQMRVVYDIANDVWDKKAEPKISSPVKHQKPKTYGRTPNKKHPGAGEILHPKFK